MTAYLCPISYDPFGNLTNIDYAVSTDVRFQYDALNRVTNMVDAAGTTKYAYTAANQLLTEDGPFSNDTLTNTYTHRLRTSLGLQQSTGVWTNRFGYDTAKRLTNVTSSAGAFNYTYDPARIRLPIKLALPNSAYITNTHDTVARLTGTYLKNSSHSVLDSYVYAYNPANHRTNLTRSDSSTVAFSYDKIGQLKVADSSVSTEDRGYLYDAAWNLNYRTNNGVLATFSVNVKNELTNAPGGSYTYDANGNLTGASSQFYTYDDENRLAKLEVYSGGDPSAKTEWVYDGVGRLRQRLEYGYSFPDWYLTEEVRYVYDGWRVVQERNSTTPTVSYTRGNDLSGSLEGAGGIGGLLARSHGYSGGNWTTHNCYFADGNGNIVRLVNSSQTVVASYRYDSFANLISSSGSLAAANVYRFSSKEIHLSTGMYYYGYRFYEPNLQRWLNRDPLGEDAGINLYGFLANSPVRFVDHFGLAYGNPVPPCAPYPECVRQRPPPRLPPTPALVPPTQVPKRIPTLTPGSRVKPPLPVTPLLRCLGVAGLLLSIPGDVPEEKIRPKPEPVPANRNDTCTLDHRDPESGLCYYNCDEMGYSVFPPNDEGNCPDIIYPEIKQEE